MGTDLPAIPVTADAKVPATNDVGPETAASVRIIDQRVDWFELRFRVVFEEAFLKFLHERAKTARRNGGGKGGRAPFRWASGALEETEVAGVPWKSPTLTHLILNGDLAWATETRTLEARTVKGEIEIAAWRAGCRGGGGERIEHAAVRAASPHAVLVGQLRLGGKPGTYVLQNADNRIEIDTTAVELGADGRRRPGWNLKIQWRAQYLAANGADAYLSRIIASECGRVVGAEIMRLDLAVTFAGWAVHDGDRLRLVKRSRANVQRYYGGDEESPAMTAYGLKDCTGFLVSPGNDVVGRIYDKRRELVAHHDARWRKTKDGTRTLVHATEKGRTELDIWRERGADPSAEPISRVEFQLRGAALDELKLRDPRTFRANVDGAWRYLVGTDSETIDAAKAGIKAERAKAARARRRGDLGTAAATEPRIAELRAQIAAARARGEGHPGWMRMIEPPAEGQRRTRAALDPRWRVVRAASFVGEGAGGAARRSRRVRLGATLKQSVGATLSALADAQRLDRFRDHEIPVLHREFPRGDPRRYEYLTEREHLETLHDDKLKHIVTHALEVSYQRAAELAAEQLLAEKSPIDAAEWLVVRINGVIDRRTSVEWDRHRADEEERLGRDAPHPQWDAATKAAFLAAKAERLREADAIAWRNAVIEPRAA